MSTNTRGSPEHAVALRYSESDDLPRVLAKGSGDIARQIIQLAEEHQIPLHKDEVLTTILRSLSVGSSINPESFTLVAEVVSFLYHFDKEWGAAHPHLQPILGSPSAPDQLE